MQCSECLVFDQVTCYGDNSVSLVDASFTLLERENLVIFGPENSGISLLCPAHRRRHFRLSRGTFISGEQALKNLNFLDTHDYRKNLGYLQAGYGLIGNMSVEENIALAPDLPYRHEHR